MVNGYCVATFVANNTQTHILVEFLTIYYGFYSSKFTIDSGPSVF